MIQLKFALMIGHKQFREKCKGICKVLTNYCVSLTLTHFFQRKIKRLQDESYSTSSYHSQLRGRRILVPERDEVGQEFSRNWAFDAAVVLNWGIPKSCISKGSSECEYAKHSGLRVGLNTFLYLNSKILSSYQGSKPPTFESIRILKTHRT